MNITDPVRFEEFRNSLSRIDSAIGPRGILGVRGVSIPFLESEFQRSIVRLLGAERVYAERNGERLHGLTQKEILYVFDSYVPKPKRQAEFERLDVIKFLLDKPRFRTPISRQHLNGVLSKMVDWGEVEKLLDPKNLKNTRYSVDISQIGKRSSFELLKAYVQHSTRAETIGDHMFTFLYPPRGKPPGAGEWKHRRRLLKDMEDSLLPIAKDIVCRRLPHPDDPFGLKSIEIPSRPEFPIMVLNLDQLWLKMHIDARSEVFERIRSRDAGRTASGTSTTGASRSARGSSRGSP